MKLRDLQHERLIHLLVTMTVAVCFVIVDVAAIIYQNLLLGVVGLPMGILLSAYVWHYFKLENQVQKKYLNKKSGV